MSKTTKTQFVDCGCCGRVHQDLFGVDCRYFVTCQKCGDAYPTGVVHDSHMATCDGQPIEDYLRTEDFVKEINESQHELARDAMRHLEERIRKSRKEVNQS